MSGTVIPTWSPPRSPGIPIMYPIWPLQPNGSAILLQNTPLARLIWIHSPGSVAPAGRPLPKETPDAEDKATPSRRWVERALDDGGGLEGRRPRAARHDAGPAAPHPRLRGDGPRAGRRGPRARPRALQHRPGGRRGRLDRVAALGRRGQRLAPRPPSVPRQVADPRDEGRERPVGPGDPGGRRGAAAHPRRDPRARAGLLRGARRLHAPAVVRGGGA